MSFSVVPELTLLYSEFSNCKNVSNCILFFTRSFLRTISGDSRGKKINFSPLFWTRNIRNSYLPWVYDTEICMLISHIPIPADCPVSGLVGWLMFYLMTPLIQLFLISSDVDCPLYLKMYFVLFSSSSANIYLVLYIFILHLTICLHSALSMGSFVWESRNELFIGSGIFNLVILL